MIDDVIDMLKNAIRRQVKCVPEVTYDPRTDILYVELQGINRNFIYKVYTFSGLLYQGIPIGNIAKRILAEYKKFIINYFFVPIDKPSKKQ